MPTSAESPAVTPTADVCRVLDALMRLRGHGLNLTQATTLFLVAAHGPMTLAAAAIHTRLTSAAMTLAVDSLEKSGLISREPDPEDRRMWKLTLTFRGEWTIKSLTNGLSRKA